MASQLKVGIVLSAIDKATAPLRGLSRSAGGTQAALAKLGGQASKIGKLRGLRSEVGSLGSKLDVSRKQTAELGREFKKAADPSEKLRKAFERSQRRTVELARAHKRQKGELRDLSASLRKAGVDTRLLDVEQARLDRTSERLRRRLDRLGRTDASPRRSGGGFLPGVAGGLLGSAAFAGAGRAVRSLGGFVETASMFETMETTLGTIEGSSNKARASMGWISDFAARTPFEIDQVSEAFVKLRAYGMSPTGGLLRTLGDTASAMGKDVMQAVEAIADAVTGENERLKEFGIKARTSGDTITYEYGGGKLATANARDRAEIQSVLAGIMDEQYSGAMADRMKTFSGMMSNLGDQWTRFQLKVMESGPFEVLKGRLRGVLERIDAMSESGELQELADRVGQGFVTAFETFEQDVWPVLKDEVWPALKEIGSVVGEILKGANDVAKAIGGWGAALKGLGLLAMGRIVLGGGRKLAGAGSSALDLGGDVKDALTSKRAKTMRRSVGRLASSGLDLAKPAADMAKSGLGKAAGGLRRFGGTLASLALRFAPLAMGALKALAAALAGLSLPVTAAIAAIAAIAYLVWKHWEPIKGFFAKLWEGVKAAFSSAWEKLSSIDWSGLGKRLLATLAAGIKAAAGLPWQALKGALGKVADLLPGSDARAGPLSRLTASGAAILPTLGAGVLRSGASPLQRPLARALGTAAAGLALAIPAPAIPKPAIAAIAAGAYLVWKHWEPIKGFFAKLWEGVKAAFSSAWEKLSSIDWSGLGKRLLATLAAGIKAAAGLPWQALKGALGKVADLLPGSDARAGPLSRLTASGAAILPTLGAGVLRSGASPLQRPLARALGTAAAGLALAIPAPAIPKPAIPAPRSVLPQASVSPRAPAPESIPPGDRAAGSRPPAPESILPGDRAAGSRPSAQEAAPGSVTRVVHHHYRVAIQQQPGEDAQGLAERVIRELERRQALAGREVLGDVY